MYFFLDISGRGWSNFCCKINTLQGASLGRASKALSANTVTTTKLFVNSKCAPISTPMPCSPASARILTECPTIAPATAKSPWRTRSCPVLPCSHSRTLPCSPLTSGVARSRRICTPSTASVSSRRGNFYRRKGHKPVFFLTRVKIGQASLPVTD